MLPWHVRFASKWYSRLDRSCVTSQVLCLCQVVGTHSLRPDCPVLSAIYFCWIIVGVPSVSFNMTGYTANFYSSKSLRCTVTTWWLSQWRHSHYYLVPDAVTTGQWLHHTHAALGIHYLGAHEEIWLLLGNYTVTTWAATRYGTQ